MSSVETTDLGSEPHGGIADLTAREKEVLALLGDRLTNRIATIFISVALWNTQLPSSEPASARYRPPT